MTGGRAGDDGWPGRAGLCHSGFVFDPKAYGEEVASLLALDGNGTRLMPLALGRCSSPEALRRLQAGPALEVLPKTALAGLYVYFSCMDRAHEIAQDIASAEGSYW